MFLIQKFKRRKNIKAIMEVFTKTYEIRLNFKINSKYTADLYFPVQKIIIDFKNEATNEKIINLEKTGYIVLSIIDLNDIYSTLSRIVYVIKQRE